MWFLVYEISLFNAIEKVTSTSEGGISKFLGRLCEWWHKILVKTICESVSL